MPAGRPTKLTQLYRTGDDGTRVTVADHVIQAIRAGNYIEAAAGSAGIEKAAVYDWLRQGARISTDIEEGRRQPPRKGTKEAALLAFSYAVAEAEAEWEVGANATLERLGRRRPVTETRETIETGADGKTISTKVQTLRKTEEADSATIRWRLERKYPKRYGRQLVEVSGPEGGPIQVEAKAALRVSVEAMVERMAANRTPEALPPGDDG